MSGSPLPRWERAVLNLFGGLVVLMMTAIVAQVVLGFFGVNPVATFSRAWPLVGDRLTLNSFLDLQWHLLAAIALLPAWLVWIRDRHVRVDVLQARFGPRSKAGVELAGHVLLTLPFLVMALPASWTFTLRAVATGETSRDGGLVDRFLVKGMIPLGLGLLLAVVLVDVVVQLRRLARGR